MTRIEAVDPEGHYRPVRRYYSQTMRVEAGPLVFVSGTAPFGPDGSLVGHGDAAAQARAVLENLRVALRAHGADLSDLVSLDVFLADASDYEAVGGVRSEYFADRGPTGILVVGAMPPLPGVLVTMRGIAAPG